RLVHVGIASHLDHDGRDATLPPPERIRHVRAGEGHIPRGGDTSPMADSLDLLHERVRRMERVRADADGGPVRILRRLVRQWAGGERVAIDHEAVAEAVDRASYQIGSGTRVRLEVRSEQPTPFGGVG